MRTVHRPLLGLTVAAMAIACSTSASTPADAGLPSTMKCGAGGLTGTVRIMDGTTLGSIAGATVTVSGCNPSKTDDSGTLQADFEQGKLLKAHFSASGYIPEHGEVTPQAAGFFRTVSMLPEGLRAPLFPGWTSGSGYAIVNISTAGGDAGPCPSAIDLVVSVKDHPELPVAYLKDINTRSATATAIISDEFPVAAIGPIPPGTYEFDAVKTGCTAGPDFGKYFTWPQTVDVEADTLTAVQLKLP